MANTNDEIRDMLLRRFYEIHSRCLGITETFLETSTKDLFKMRSELGLERAKFFSNLDYLVEKGWILKTDRTESETDPVGGLTTHHYIGYRISAEGIDRLEGASRYQREDLTKKINITNIKGVTILETGNIVNLEYVDLYRAIDDLQNRIVESKQFTEEQKLDLTSDLATVQTQISKTKPDKVVIQRIWSGIERAVTAVEFANSTMRISALIKKISL
jgi:hypothetical protein